MLELVTFTGVDAHTDLMELAKVASEYPRAEFAVLAGSQTGRDNPIFPPMETIRALRNLDGVNTALHLCGKYARMAAGGHFPSWPARVKAQGFGRVQVNLHEDVENPTRVRVAASSVRRFAQEAETGSIILQHRADWDEVPVDHPKIEYLFDLSEGRGEEGFEHWPDPPEGRRVGYAGGLGPHNITRALEFAARHPDARIWFDMEHNVRDQNHRFDLEKVREVCQLAFAPRPG